MARADASSAFQSLYLALGAVALLVGGIGIANIMVISVLERRGEIGLRRAMGARRVHMGGQFVSEAPCISALGGVAGAVLGALTVTVYASLRGWSASVPPAALAGRLSVALAVGPSAGSTPPGEPRASARLRPCGRHDVVGDRDQAQALGRGRVGHAVAGERPEALHEAGRVLPAPAHLHQAAPTRERTIWWQNEPAVMSKRSRRPLPAPSVAAPSRGHLGRVVHAPLGPGRPGARSARSRRCPAGDGRTSGSRGCRAGRRTPCAWRPGRAGRARARPRRPAAGRAPVRSRPGSGRPGPWPSAGRRSPAAPPRPGRTTTWGASWRLSARARPAPS